MKPDNADNPYSFSDAVVSLMLGRAIAEALSDVPTQPLPARLLELLRKLDQGSRREAAWMEEGRAYPRAPDH